MAPNNAEPRLVTRAFPDASCEWLRHQVGFTEMRTVHVPIWKKADILRKAPDTIEVQVFHLLAFASSEKLAKSRAARALARAKE